MRRAKAAAAVRCYTSWVSLRCQPCLHRHVRKLLRCWPQPRRGCASASCVTHHRQTQLPRSSTGKRRTLHCLRPRRTACLGSPVAAPRLAHASAALQMRSLRAQPPKRGACLGRASRHSQWWQLRSSRQLAQGNQGMTGLLHTREACCALSVCLAPSSRSQTLDAFQSVLSAVCRPAKRLEGRRVPSTAVASFGLYVRMLCQYWASCKDIYPEFGSSHISTQMMLLQRCL